MIISTNNRPSLEEFKNLMIRTDEILNKDACERPAYYAKRTGIELEDDVTYALHQGSRGTAFENTIVKVSGSKFPDIVAAKYYGVEVKSTKDDHWTSTGSSILESTRIKDVERIYMTFGKLGGRPEFLSKPYEKCLSGIAVTHMPRYKIDMRLKEGETIFDKINIPYDTLRKMKNPVKPVSDYYKKQLKPGESLWWISNPDEEAVSATVRLWKNVETKEKGKYTAYALVHYTEVFEGRYDNYALWLTSQGIADGHIRDQFSAGGKEDLEICNGTYMKFPGIYRRVRMYKKEILKELAKIKQEIDINDTRALNRRAGLWIDHVSRIAENTGISDYKCSSEALRRILLR